MGRRRGREAEDRNRAGSEILNLLFALICASAFAKGAPKFEVPAITGPVVDDAGLLSPRAADAIDGYLRRLREAGGTQVTVATVPDIGDLSIEEASIRIVDAWKLGDKKVDDGVLILIAAKQRRLRIEVGRGREGVLPDVIASRIVREVMIPRLRADGADRAVAEGVRAVVARTDPEFASRASLSEHHRGPRRDVHVGLFHVIVWILLLLFFIGGNRFFGAGVLTGGLMRGPLGGWGGRDDDDRWSGGGGGFSGGGASGEW